MHGNYLDESAKHVAKTSAFIRTRGALNRKDEANEKNH